MAASDLSTVTVTAKAQPPGPRMSVYQPQVKVTLVKTTRRQSLGAASGLTGAAISPATTRVGRVSVVDLTPYLSDSGGVRTQKSVRGPMGGFSLVLEDRLTEFGDSLYGLIEPQDIIEIRMARVATGVLPLVMRGLVSEVSRARSIEGGQPVRMVTVNGHDFGKVLEQLRIYYLRGSTVGEVWLDQFKFFRQYNGAAKQKPAGEFLAEVCTNVINPYLARMLSLLDKTGLAVGLPSEFVPESTIKGLVSPLGISSVNDASVYQLLSQFLDVGAFNELFVEDRETSVVLVCRPAPWRNLSGEYIDQSIDHSGVNEFLLDDGDLISQTASRSDQGVANYFWCSNGNWEQVDNGRLQLDATKGDNFYTTDYVNTRVSLYGFRKMEVASQLGNPLMLAGYNVARTDIAGERLKMADWLTERRDLLAKSNVDNVVLESGSLKLKGNEALKAGSYLSIQRGADVSSAYAVSVSQEFIPATGFFTSVEFERGTNYVDRQQNAQAPWISERNEGGAS